MKNQKQAYIYAISAILFWSTVASAFKISLRYLNFIQLLFYASISSAIALFIIVSIQGKLVLLKQYSKRDYLRSALLGFLNPFLYYIVLFKAYSILPAQEAQPLNYTWPLVLVLLSIPILKQKIGMKSIIAVIISFIGVVIIGTRGEFRNFLNFKNFDNLRILGVSLAVGSSIIWASFWIYNMKDKRDEIVKLFLNFVFGSIFISAIILFIRLFLLIPIPFVESKLYGILGAIYVGLFEMGITFALWLKALQLSKTTAKVSNLVFLSPFISLVFIYFIVGEKILLSTIIGLIFIVSGIIFQRYDK